MTAFLYRMGSGIPGAVTRSGTAMVVEPNVLGTTPVPFYGVPVALDASQNMRPITAADVSASVYGFLVRPFPFNSGTQGLGAATPPTSGSCDVLKLGYMSVKVNYGAPVKGGIVYIRTVVNGANTIIGGVEATSDTTYSFALAGAYFTGNADANGNSEIAFNV